MAMDKEQVIEKDRASQHEVAVDGIDDAPSTAAQWTPEEEKKLRWRIDIQLFPILLPLTMLNYLDRTNFAAARLAGLEADLGLTDVEYRTCISVLLVGYVALQIPSNMIANKISRPSWYICACVALWGIVVTATGAIHNAVGAIMCRFFLGCLEAVYYPGTMLMLSRWYTRKEITLRFTILALGSILGQAFGGLIAAGILGNMEGKLGLRAWRWLFIIEGALTIFFGLLGALVLPDWPSSWKSLSERERFIAQARLAADIGLVDEDVNTSAVHGLKLAVVDPKVWLAALCYFTTGIGSSYIYFFPSITKSLGYSTTMTLLLTAPPFIFTTIFALALAWNVDRMGQKCWHFLACMVLPIIGCILILTTNSVGPRYLALFFITTSNVGGIVIISWISSTFPRPPAKRAVVIALVNAAGNTGFIPGSYMWPGSWAPYYRESLACCMAMLAFACGCAIALRFILVRLNKGLDREERQAFEISEGALETTAKLEHESGHAVRENVKAFHYLL